MLRSIRLFTDSSKPESHDHRLVVLRWKETEKKKAHAARCVSIPKLDVSVTPAILGQSLTDAFYELQDTIIRELVEKHLATHPNEIAQTIDDADYSYEAVAAWSQAQAISKRLSKETIEQWFDHNLRDNLMVALANANNIGDDATPEQLARITKATSNYRTVIANLASPRANYDETEVRKLQKALSNSESTDDPIYLALNSRLTKFLEPTKISLEMDL